MSTPDSLPLSNRPTKAHFPLDEKSLACRGSNPSAMPGTSASGRRVCILVLGMHRSGTSAVTRVISLLGAALPKNLMPARAGDNEHGFWEPRDLWTLNDQLLADAGSRWDDWRKEDASAMPAERVAFHTDQIRRSIDDDFGNAGLIVIKDPRICRVVSMYVDILATLGYQCRFVLALRDPFGVAASLGRRNGMSRDFASLLWLRYMLDAEAATRGLPRVAVSYDAMMTDWRGTVARLASGLDVDWPHVAADADGNIAEFLRADRAPLSNRIHARAAGTIESWVSDAYAALLRVTANAHDKDACVVLDRVSKEFDTMSSEFGEGFFAELNARERNFDTQRGELRDHIVGLDVQLNEKEALIHRLVVELEERQRVIDDLAQQCSDRSPKALEARARVAG